MLFRSEERRNGTLGLLVLTGLRPLEIFAHKLFGAVWLATFSLLGGLPFFAIPFLTGGVLPTQFLCALVFLANALLFCIAVGLLASVIHSEGGQAQITAVAATAGLSLATPAMHWISQEISGVSALQEGWLTLSPAYAPFLVYTGFRGSSPQMFWACSSYTLVCSLIALLLSALILQRTWRGGPGEFSPAGLGARWLNGNRGASTARRKVRAPHLERNPFGWLAARDRWPGSWRKC